MHPQQNVGLAAKIEASRQHAMIVAVAESLAPAHGGELVGSAEELHGKMFGTAAPSPDVPTCATHLEHLLREMSAGGQCADRLSIGKAGPRTWRLRPRPRPRAMAPATASPASAGSPPRAAAGPASSASAAAATVPASVGPLDVMPGVKITPGTDYAVLPINISPLLRAVVEHHGGDVTWDSRAAMYALCAYADSHRIAEGHRWPDPLPGSAAQAGMLLSRFVHDRRSYGAEKALSYHAGLEVTQLTRADHWRVRIAAPTHLPIPRMVPALPGPARAA